MTVLVVFYLALCYLWGVLLAARLAGQAWAKRVSHTGRTIHPHPHGETGTDAKSPAPADHPGLVA